MFEKIKMFVFPITEVKVQIIKPLITNHIKNIKLYTECKCTTSAFGKWYLQLHTSSVSKDIGIWSWHVVQKRPPSFKIKLAAVQKLLDLDS